MCSKSINAKRSSESGRLWQYRKNSPGDFLKIGRFGARASRTKPSFRRPHSLLSKYCSVSVITTVDKAVNIVAYQADIDVSDALAQSVCGFALAYGLGKAVLVLGGGFRLHGGIPFRHAFDSRRFWRLRLRVRQRRKIEIAVPTGWAGWSAAGIGQFEQVPNGRQNRRTVGINQ